MSTQFFSFVLFVFSVIAFLFGQLFPTEKVVYVDRVVTVESCSSSNVAEPAPVVTLVVVVVKAQEWQTCKDSDKTGISFPGDSTSKDGGKGTILGTPESTYKPTTTATTPVPTIVVTTPAPVVTTPSPVITTPAPVQGECDRANPGNPDCKGNSQAPKFQGTPGLGIKGNSDTLPKVNGNDNNNNNKDNKNKPNK
jgi:hypothetical protein